MKPRDYQHKAINSVEKAFRRKDRASIVMACGTGKTLVGLWVAERLNSKRTIIFMPSLALIKQTIESWNKCSKHKDVDIYSICSEKDMYDDIDIKELNGSVLGSTEEINKSLSSKPTSYEFVFCTYQSTELIPPTIKFNLGIFDEAHKTAHEAEKGFRYPLYNENISIEKRLFMTATPKLYTYKKSFDTEKADFSMDNQELYGKTVFTLDFAEALKKSIICDYKVIITLINDEEVKKTLPENYLLSKNAMALRAKAIGLARSYQDLPISKSISFHRTIKESQDFTKELASIIDKTISNLHINGKMNNDQRAATLTSFKNHEKANISNARFLSEGVDIPATDLVAFMSPKKSKIDIIQTVGRVMRKHPTKKCGYILIPIFIEKKELKSIDAKLLNSQYRYLWTILNSLAHYDKSLRAEISETEQHKGSFQGKSHKIQIVDDMEFNGDLMKAIDIYIIKNIGDDWDKQYEIYGKILNDDTNTQISREDRAAAKKWARYQRALARMGYLSDEKKKKLNQISFQWNAAVKSWEENFKLFKETVESGKISELTNYATNVASWLRCQRNRYLHKTLPPENAKMILDVLKSIGQEKLFRSGTVRTYKRLNIMDECKKYYKRHGHCNITKSHSASIAIWLSKVRRGVINISDDTRAALDSYGMNWNYTPMHLRWDKKYNELLAYIKKYKTLSFPVSRQKEYKGLASWLAVQRKNVYKKTLTKEQKEKLKKIGAFNRGRQKRKK